MAKEFTTGIKPEGYNWKEAMKKPLVISYIPMEEDFIIYDYDENDNKVPYKYKAGDYLLLGKHDNLYGVQKDEFEKEHNLEVTEEYKIRRYMANKDNRKMLLSLASHIDSLMRSNWFTLDKLVKKSKEDKNDLNDRLALLILMGLCKYHVGEKEVKYKIVLEPEQRKYMIEENIKEMQEKIDSYKEELERIDNEAKE